VRISSPSHPSPYLLGPYGSAAAGQLAAESMLETLRRRRRPATLTTSRAYLLIDIVSASAPMGRPIGTAGAVAHADLPWAGQVLMSTHNGPARPQPKLPEHHNAYRVFAVVENGKKHSQWVMDSRRSLESAVKLTFLQAQHLAKEYPWERGDVAAVHVVNKNLKSLFAIRVRRF